MRQPQLAAGMFVARGGASAGSDADRPAQFPSASPVVQVSPRVSIIVPTINEADNLEPLTRRIATAMSGLSFEILVIDDGSQDGTAGVCGHLAGRYPLTLHVRPVPTAGLSGAVLYGFARARGDILVVMDADLQHPPEALPALLAPLLAGDADFVIGSRNIHGGRVASSWGMARRLNSRLAQLLAAPLVGTISDPMSGFFSLHRNLWLKCWRINPIGYKIGLELMCRCAACRIVEIPIEFRVRESGLSKLTTMQ
jgi:dolichol-phosphate mannosyltransferase